MTTTTTISDAPAPPRTPNDRVVVLHLLPDLAIGGGQTIVLQHVRKYDRGRFHVVVAHLGGDRSLAAQFADAGATPIDLGEVGAVTTVARVTRLLRQTGADVLHVHSGRDRKLGQVAALLTRTPVVGHVHSEWIHLGARWPDGAGALRRARGHATAWIRDGIERRTVRVYLAESRAVRTLFAPLVGQRVAVLDQAIPLDRFDDVLEGPADIRADIGVDPAAPMLVTVARMVEGKGHLALLEVIERVRAGIPDVVLVVVGDGHLRPEVEAGIRDRGLTENVRLLGDRHDVPRILRAADCFVFGSETEGFGLAPLEGMAARLPVVAFRLPALQEFVADGESGHLVDPGDTASFAASVAGLVADRARATQLGARGREIVEQRFPMDAVARSMAPVHEEAAGRPGREEGSRAD